MSEIIAQHKWGQWDKCVSRVPESFMGWSLFSFSLLASHTCYVLTLPWDTGNAAVNQADHSVFPPGDPTLDGGGLQIHPKSDRLNGEE